MNETIIVSLGPNCYTAGIIKALNYKKCSYPFDWILSNCKIVVDCIKTDFSKFLDKQHYTSCQQGNCHKVGHTLYKDHDPSVIVIK